MRQILCSLVPSGAITLINNLIAGTPDQDFLVNWKHNHNVLGGDEGLVGVKY